MRKAGERSKATRNIIFAISCVFAVSLDPLFFYVLIIDQDDKCLQMDKTLSIVACLTRSLTDVIFLGHFICEIYDRVQNAKPQTQKNGGNSHKKTKIRKLIDQVAMKIAQKMPWLSVFTVIGFFALLPLPQYFPRIYRIYLSAEDFKMINGMWIKGLYNMFLYILSSHTFMQMEATKKEEMRQKMKMKKLDVHTWMATNELPNDLREEILSSIKQTLKQKTLKQHIDADLHNFLFSILPGKTRTSLKRCLCMKTLQKVKMLQGMDDKVLTLMCDYLKPVTYIENSNIFRMGDPLDCVLIIMEGTVWTYASSDSQAGRGISSMGTKPLRKGDFYGEELFDWAPGSFTELPVSSKHVKTRIKVDAFLLTANDLDSVVSKHRLQWKKEGTLTPAMKIMAASTIATAFRSGRRLRAINKAMIFSLQFSIVTYIDLTLTDRSEQSINCNEISNLPKRKENLQEQSFLTARRVHLTRPKEIDRLCEFKKVSHIRPRERGVDRGRGSGTRKP
ncbi:hypothetical protein DVH24_022401 [Malus domestica]|uniref:Cyclic nucleotide-binding domain-containing protein n=1 Tax=Malus domestica TaxID=3750 RepID=A0A498KLA1_MALDO|nr:hypothetical protein DVH24_022401 [Malus domestica]